MPAPQQQWGSAQNIFSSLKHAPGGCPKLPQTIINSVSKKNDFTPCLGRGGQEEPVSESDSSQGCLSNSISRLYLGLAFPGEPPEPWGQARSMRANRITIPAPHDLQLSDLAAGTAVTRLPRTTLLRSPAAWGVPAQAHHLEPHKCDVPGHGLTGMAATRLSRMTCREYGSDYLQHGAGVLKRTTSPAPKGSQGQKTRQDGWYGR